MWSDVVHFVLGDDTQVDVAARAQIIKDACSNGITHKLLGCILLWKQIFFFKLKITSSHFFFFLNLQVACCVYVNYLSDHVLTFILV